MTEQAIKSTQYTKKSQQSTDVLPRISDKDGDLWSGCLQGKMTVATILKESMTRTTQPLWLVHSDVIVPIKSKTRGGSHSCCFIDDFSKHVNAYFLKTKNEVATKFIEYIGEMERQCWTKINAIRTENGREFKKKRSKNFAGGMESFTRKQYPSEKRSCFTNTQDTQGKREKHDEMRWCCTDLVVWSSNYRGHKKPVHRFDSIRKLF